MSIPIPNTLTIYINTSVPGSQFLKYTPSMTIPETKSKLVCFDPLVKLSQSRIDLTPEPNRISQFFDKNLFNTLIAQTGNFQPIRTLKMATQDGIIDDNIELTLQNIFKKDSIFYIKDKPYTIFSVEWERGNWKIDTKITEVPTNYRGQYGISSINYRNTISAQLQEAQQELNQLPPDIKNGNNFSNENISIPIALPIPESISEPKPMPSVKPIPATTPTPIPRPTPTPIPENRVVPYNPPDTTRTDTTTIVKPITTTNDTTMVIPTNPTTTPQISYVSDIVPPKELFNNSVTMVTIHNTNKNINSMRNFFREPKYFYLINSIYKSSNETDKAIIRDAQKIFVKDNIGTFNKKSYDEIVKSLHIIPNNGKGNCFFISVASAINDYNQLPTNQKTKITYLEYGTSDDNPFTQIVIRTIIANGILKNASLLHDILEVATANANKMNNEFDSITEPITDANYETIINDIYTSNDNFFIKKPEKELSNKNIKDPFSVINTYEEQKIYLLYDSWTDERTIPILQLELGLTVIIIDKYENKYRFPFPYITKNTDPLYNNWNKYMFIYFQAGHYEQINFDTYVKRDNKKIKQTVSIFNRTKPLIPPINFIFLLFGSFYYPINEEYKTNTMVLREFLKQIELNFNKITSHINNKSITFINNFVNYFPSVSSKLLKDTMTAKFEAKELDKSKTNVMDETKPEVGEEKDEPLVIEELDPVIDEPVIDEPVIEEPVVEELDPNTNIVGGAIKQNPHFTSSLEKKSNISYYIVVTLELYPGKEIPIQQKVTMGCDVTHNNLKKAWAEFLGKRYALPPSYREPPTTPKQTVKNQPTNNNVRTRRRR